MSASPRTQAAIFDFDHTLAPLGSYVRWPDAVPLMKERYRDLGVPDSVLDGPPGCLVLYRRVADWRGVAPPELTAIQREASAIISEFEAEAIPHTLLFPHVAELTELALPLGIVTSNSSRVVQAVLKRADAATQFGVVVGRDDVEAIKPSPEGLLLCSRQLGVAPGNCVYVGDMPADMSAAHAASMPAYGVLTGIGSEEELRGAGATEVFEDLAAVHAALLTTH